MALGDAEAVADFFETYGCGGLQVLGGQARSAKLRRERHREPPGVRRGQLLFGIGAGAVLETRTEGILGLLEDVALGGNRSFAALEVPLPDGTPFALHVISPCCF